MSDRELLKKNFLVAQKLDNAQIEPLPADASFRTYARIKTADKSYILMDAPPGKEDIKPFMKVAKFLRELKLSAPEIIANDEKNGFLLLEDFGDAKYSKLLAEKNDSELETLLYENAIKLLAELHKSATPDSLVPYYDDEKLLEEALLLTEWYIPILNGEPLAAKLKEEYEIIWRHLLQYTRYIPETTVLRDYHADNLMWIEDRYGINRVGVLDFQDAVIGSPVYDIVSLLEDARRDVSQDLSERMVTYYLNLRNDISRKDFLASYSILGAQRNLKIIGRFACKAIKDKNSAYLKFLPRVWGYVEKDLKHPLLMPLKGWLDKVISPQVRKPNNPKVALAG